LTESTFSTTLTATFFAWVRRALKKSLLITFAVVLAPVILVGLVALAAGDWRQIGATEAGDKVSVSSIRVQKHNLRTAWVRVEYKEPARFQQGGPFAELRARVRFNCATGTATPNSEWWYSLERNGRLAVSKKTARDEQFGSASEGNFGEMTRSYVCQQK
jgi:Surface-adhesin protein E